MATEAVRTVPQVLNRFEHEFSDFIGAFADGGYDLWLGSGISREVVPNVEELLERVLEMLRGNSDLSGATCPYRKALEEALGMADISQETHESIDFGTPVASWPAREDILKRLSSRYAEVLDISVVGQPSDYLVWSGLDAANTYGDPALEPDVEHVCVALLLLEGVVMSVVTANWDGLIERALTVLGKPPDTVTKVIVNNDDFRRPKRPTELIKFHGCAVRAREDESGYRHRLIARKQQISTWSEKAENQLMRKHLENLYSDHSSLIMGLSLQDADMHTMIARAIRDFERPWPEVPAAVVMAEEYIQAHHRHVLRITYGAAYETHQAEIDASALLGSYAKPTLLALVLWTLTEKFAVMIGCVRPAPLWDLAQTERLKSDLHYLRDVVASHAGSTSPENRMFLARLIDLTTLALSVFRTGLAPITGDVRYEPVSDRPIRDASQNANFPTEAFGRFAIAISLLARGHASDDWTLLPGEAKEAEKGVVRLASTTHEVRVFIVKDSPAAITLTMEGLADENDVNTFIVLADREPPATVRSPRPRYGRVGKERASRISIEDLHAEAESADDLYESFKLAGGF